ncbi:hypothetical protein QP020_09445 [Gallibacterium anatis]|uniref:hypothetical protein n=1 Tax=Gallibacterium anatis TaxID=750 RepID=UPI00254B1108|nr:hypothetical protein [Gallibacterium anatis]WIM83984.1 hypothetical protein QP020_09445 [Gallibacterium anatis]
MAGKTWRQQLSINAIYQGITLSDKNLSNEDFMKTLGSSIFGNTISFGIDQILLNNRTNPLIRQTISKIIGNSIEIPNSKKEDNQQRKFSYIDLLQFI